MFIRFVGMIATIGLTGFAIRDALVGDWVWFWINIAGLLLTPGAAYLDRLSRGKLPAGPTVISYEEKGVEPVPTPGEVNVNMAAHEPGSRPEDCGLCEAIVRLRKAEGRL